MTKYLAAMWMRSGPKRGFWKLIMNASWYERPNVLAVSASYNVLNLVFAKLYGEDQVWDDQPLQRYILK
jgi:hypothetical protein